MRGGLKKRIRKQKQMYISLEGSRRKESKRLLGQKRGQMDGGSRPRGRLFKYRRGGNGDGQEIRKRHSHKNSHNRGCLWAPVELERLEIGRKSPQQSMGAGGGGCEREQREKKKGRRMLSLL